MIIIIIIIIRNIVYQLPIADGLLLSDIGLQIQEKGDALFTNVETVIVVVIAVVVIF